MYIVVNEIYDEQLTCKIAVTSRMKRGAFDVRIPYDCIGMDLLIVVAGRRLEVMMSIRSLDQMPTHRPQYRI